MNNSKQTKLVNKENNPQASN